MLLQLSRRPPHGNALFGTLKVNGTFECFTLENQAVCIPAGTYPISAYFSPHAKHLVPLLLNVPGRDYIEMHCGNLPCDSRGCVLVGQGNTQDTLENSRLAFDHLFPQIMDAIQRQEPVSIEIDSPRT